jgi:hypothetical protein
MAGALRRLVLAVALLAAAAFGACGGGDGGEAGAQNPAGSSAIPWLDPGGDYPVVGSLAVNPADDTLWMSTNTGLFRVPGGTEPPAKVTGTLTTPDGSGTISEELVVSFTGPDQLLGSGHPSPDETSLPEALGLIASEDGGKTWTSVSELGTADFHAIRRSGDRLVASEFGRSRVLVSGDDGRTSEARAAPRILIDIEVNPGDPRRWIATADDGVYVSRDEGGTWRAIDPTPNSYLAWPAPDALYRLDPGGPLKRSRDAGATWEDVGDTGGEPQALTATDPETLYAALLDGTVKRSVDGGRTWTDHLTP